MVKLYLALLVSLMVAACGFNERQLGDRGCTSVQDCPRPDQTCSENTCVQQSCSASSDCGRGFAFSCSGGGCVAQTCSSPADCGAGFTCTTTGYCATSFNVDSAVAISNTSIAVTFDAPPDMATASALGHYAIDGLTVSGTPTVSGSTVTLVTSPQTSTGYTVTVSGVTRANDQAPLNAATAQFAGRSSFNVTSANAISARSITLTFDAPPDQATATTLANYSINGNLTVSGTPTLSGNTVTLVTSAQAVQAYTVTVTGVRRASDGEGLTNALAMFGGRNDFNVTTASAVASTSISVAFDAIPNTAQATNLANYSVVDASSNPLPLSGSPTLSADMMSVTIATAQQSAGTYTVQVSNVTRGLDAEPLNLRSANFTGRVSFNVVSATPISSTSVRVTFDAVPTTAEANDPGNYDIPGLSVDAAVLSGNIVTLTTSQQSATPYTLAVSGVTRASDGETLSVGTASFTGRAPFDVVGAASVTSHSATVTFDAPPNAVQATTVGNYNIPGLTVIGATYPGTGNTVTLTTSAQSATMFSVTVTGVTRDPDTEPLTLAVASFSGRTTFNVDSAAALTSHSITLTYDAAPTAAALTLANYSANNGLTFSSVSLSSPTTVTLTTSVQTATSYQVTITNVARASDNEPMTISTAVFMGRPSFDVASASSTGNTSITVTFSAAPTPAQATSLASYAITSGSLTLSGTPVLSGNTVTIATSAQTSGASYTITASGVTRLSDGEPLTNTSASFIGKSGFNVASATSVSTTSMSVTFDAPPDPTTATNVNNYSVPGLTLSGPVSLSGSTVTMTTTAQAGQTYTVTVSNVVRAVDNVALTGNTASFTHTTFNVSNASAITSHSVTVTFDALPNSAQATTLSNYVIKDQNNVTLAISGTPTLNTTTNTVTITTAVQTAGKTYTVTVSNVTRASDGTTLTTKTASFAGIGAFNVASAAAPSSASITVTFDAPPNATQATTLANYSIPNLVLSGTPILSGNTVTIATTVQMATSYTITVNNVTRASDAESLTTKTATFTGKAQSAPTVTNVVVQSTNPNNGTTFYNTGSATVVITGTQFTGVSCPSGVTLDDQNGNGTMVKTPATSCTVDSDTQITATFPAGIRTNGLTGWNVRVTNTIGANTTSTVKLVVKAGLVVSEVYTGNGGGGGTVHEFVEIYNRTATAIDVTGQGIGLAIHVRDGNGADTNLALSGITGGHKTIPSHGFWLACSSESTASDSWFAHKDASYGAAAIGGNGALVSSGSVYLSLSATAQAKVLDKLGWKSQPAGGFETAVYASDITTGNSAQRKPAGGAGATTDTDVNNSDFNLPSNSITPLGTADPVQP